MVWKDPFDEPRLRRVLPHLPRQHRARALGVRESGRECLRQHRVRREDRGLGFVLPTVPVGTITVLRWHDHEV